MLVVIMFSWTCDVAWSINLVGAKPAVVVVINLAWVAVGIVPPPPRAFEWGGTRVQTVNACVRACVCVCVCVSQTAPAS